MRFGPLWSRPKPAHRPHPPVIVGGEGPTVLDRVVHWLPSAGWAVVERLFIASGTVKVHLSHIFAKLVIPTGAELAGLAVAQGRADRYADG